MEPRRPRGKASSHRAEKVLSASAKKAAGAEARAAAPREGKAKDGGNGGGARAMPGWMFSQRVAQPDLALLNASLRLPETDLSLERLFVSRPRVLIFSHRPLFSIRHPFVQGRKIQKKALPEGTNHPRGS
ncbi:hypothetical protein DIPPA_20987 [Diplonema papillatum]|nr:hypothetical protein DIPPA_20987 [Diplonema papillatum]